VTRPDKKHAWRDSRVAAEYEARRFRRWGQRLKHRHDVALVLSLLRGAGDVRSVLDLPTGTGRIRPALEEAGYSVIGADVSAEMLAAGTHAIGVDPPASARVQAEGEHLPFSTSSFDAVVSLRFLFHVRDPRTRHAILREMGRVASRVVIGQVRYRGTWKHATRWARRRIGLGRRFRPASGAGEIARELEEAGLEILRLVPVSRLFSDKALFVARPR